MERAKKKPLELTPVEEHRVFVGLDATPKGSGLDLTAFYLVWLPHLTGTNSNTAFQAVSTRVNKYFGSGGQIRTDGLMLMRHPRYSFSTPQ